MKMKMRYAPLALLLTLIACSPPDATGDGKREVSVEQPSKPAAHATAASWTPATVSNADEGDGPGIVITPSGITQYEVSCFVTAKQTGPDGAAFQLTAPVRAMRGGAEVALLIAAQAPAILEIYSSGATGATITDLAFRAPCSEITLEFGPPQCRVAVGDHHETGDCALPVRFAPMQVSQGS